MRDGIGTGSNLKSSRGGKPDKRSKDVNTDTNALARPETLPARPTPHPRPLAFSRTRPSGASSPGFARSLPAL
jgi:hypothetical protein